MPFCGACNSFIIGGGKSEGGKRYCNDRCLELARTSNYAGDIPDEIVATRAWQLRDESCPQCAGPGPLDFHRSQQVISVLILTRTSNKTIFSCKRCGNRSALKATAVTLLTGWWGVPWGLIMTPIVLVTNMVALLQSSPPGPSSQLLEAAKLDMAAQLRERVESGSYALPAPRALADLAIPIDPPAILAPALLAPAVTGYSPAKSSGLAITSLVFAVLSIVTLCMFGISLLTSLVAIVTGHTALKNIKHSQGRLTGDGMAIAGLILGYPLLLISIAFVSLLAIAISKPDPLAQQEIVHPDLPQQHVPQRNVPQGHLPPFELTAENPFPSPPSHPGPDDMRRLPNQEQRGQLGPNPFDSLANSQSRELPQLPVDPFIPPPSSGPGLPQIPPLPSARRSARPSIDRSTRTPAEPEEQVVEPEIIQAYPAMGWTVSSLAISPNKRFLVAGKIDAILIVFDLTLGKSVAEIKDLRSEMGQITRVAFSPDGKRVIATGYSGAIAAWSIDSAGHLADKQVLVKQADEVRALAISPTSKFLMSGSSRGQLLWQPITQSGTLNSRQLDALPNAVLAIYLPQVGMEALASDGQTLVAVDLRNGQQLRSVQLQSSSVRAAAFSKDGSRLAISSGRVIHVWDTATQSQVMEIDAQREIQWSVGFLPSGKSIYSGGRGRVTLWNAADGERQSILKVSDGLYIKNIAVSDDSRWLAAIPDSAGQTLTVMKIPE